MPKTELIRLSCEFCDNYKIINPMEANDKLIAEVIGWKGVVSLLQPPSPQGVDPHRWYDTPECLALGEKRFDEQIQDSLKKQAEQEELLAKANAQLRQGPYMVDKVATVGKA